MSDFLNLNWLFGKGTRRRKNRTQPLTIHSESGFERYKSGGPNSNVEVRRKSKPRSVSALHLQKRNKRTMALASNVEGFTDVTLLSSCRLRKTKKQRNQKKSKKNNKYKK